MSQRHFNYDHNMAALKLEIRITSQKGYWKSCHPLINSLGPVNNAS